MNEIPQGVINESSVHLRDGLIVNQFLWNHFSFGFWDSSINSGGVAAPHAGQA
jgi:hypothetical protein